MNKTLTIDLRWLLLPFTLLFAAISNAVQLTAKTLFGLFLFTGVGYLVIKATKGLGYDYSAGKPSWNGPYLQMKVTRRPRWATRYLGGRRRRYAIVGGPDQFYLKRSGRKTQKQALMRGFYARFALERPALPMQPIIVNAPLQTVPVPTPQPQYVPQPQYAPFNPYGGVTYGATTVRY